MIRAKVSHQLSCETCVGVLNELADAKPEDPFEVSAFVIYDEIFDEAMQTVPEDILKALEHAQHVQKLLYDKHVEKMLATHVMHA